MSTGGGGGRATATPPKAGKGLRRVLCSVRFPLTTDRHYRFFSSLHTIRIRIPAVATFITCRVSIVIIIIIIILCAQYI